MELVTPGKAHGGPTLCGAQLKQADGTCKNRAGFKTDHVGTGKCHLHGGASPIRSVKTKAERLLAEARETTRKFNIIPVDDPLTELQRVAGELVVVKDWLRGEVERLNSMRYEGKAGEQIRGELLAYQTALRDTVSVLTAIAKLNIDDRLVRIEETKVNAIVTAIEAGLADAGIQGQQAQDVKAVVARHLRAV